MFAHHILYLTYVLFTLPGLHSESRRVVGTKRLETLHAFVFANSSKPSSIQHTHHHYQRRLTPGHPIIDDYFTWEGMLLSSISTIECLFVSPSASQN